MAAAAAVNGKPNGLFQDCDSDYIKPSVIIVYRVWLLIGKCIVIILFTAPFRPRTPLPHLYPNMYEFNITCLYSTYACRYFCLIPRYSAHTTHTHHSNGTIILDTWYSWSMVNAHCFVSSITIIYCNILSVPTNIVFSVDWKNVSLH